MSLDSSPSSNSTGQRSKRSLHNTTSSYPSSCGNSKKKKSNQKTLGVSWGANSASSSRSSSRKSPFSDFGSYMVEKNRKLQDQFDADVSKISNSNSSSEKPIFLGISIFVDGFTIPSNQDLRGYMLKYGGRFENYFSRHRVTHIICSNLPDTKMKNLRSFSSGLPVVKPSWILDSISANKLLSWTPYQLDQPASNQPRLSAFFSVKSSPVLKDSVKCVTIQEKHEIEHLPSESVTLKDENLPKVDELIKDRLLIDEESDVLLRGNSTAAIVLQPSSGNRKSMKMKESSVFYEEDERNVRDGYHSSCCEPSASVSSYCSIDDNVRRSPKLAAVGPSDQHHSTLVDPNFVENYFKNSRLHFIGTWRNRYRKRFQSLPNGFKSRSSNIKNHASSGKTTIIHVDMDCFFVSVVIRNQPELKNKPVAVCHSDNPKGTAEISSANYPARDYGVKAGMFVRDAKALCPHLVILPYNFEAYEEVADQFYNILHKRCNKVQAVSCDEAFLDVTDLEGDPEPIASTIRKEISETTGCSASVGISANMLMARLATRDAKPDGQCYIPAEKVGHFLHQLPIKTLPGIGHVLEEKLKNRNIQTCGELRMISKDSLQKDFGMKTGEMLWNYSRGVDNRLVGVIQESRSVGAEVNWGVRFKDLKDSQHFLSKLCKEVSLRLQGCGVQGRTFTLKVKKRRKNAGEPIKYMGCGDCENLSHSVTVPVPSDDPEVLQRITKQLFGFFNIDVKEIRGIGLQVSKLESADTSKHGIERNVLKSWLASSSANSEEQHNINCMVKDRIDGQRQGVNGTPDQICADPIDLPIRRNDMANMESDLDRVTTPPPLSHLDMGVIKSLPPDLISELNEVYGGKLVNLIAENNCKSEHVNSCLGTSISSPELAKGLISEGDAPIVSDVIQESKTPEHMVEEVNVVPFSEARPHSVAISISGIENTDLLPSSLSQVDNSVLQELPEQLRADILDLLPAHRTDEFSSHAILDCSVGIPQQSLGVQTSIPSGGFGSVVDDNLWSGNPPLWVNKFKGSNCLILRMLAEMYHRSGSTRDLSLILQNTLSEFQSPLDASFDGWDQAINDLCKLLKQYIKLKIVLDIEEIYICFRILKRFTMKSKLFLEVYNIVDPCLQAAVSENYGGSLRISSKD